MTSFSDIKINRLNGEPDLLGPAKGDVVLVVNVASKCGYTPQYAGLEALHKELSGQGFRVIGFPCNQFGAQEPGSAEEIQSFCTTNFGVTFPVSEKIDVNGADRHPLYAWLTDDAQGVPGDIAWNFEKFLIGRDGAVRARYPAGTAPDDKGLLGDIADALD